MKTIKLNEQEIIFLSMLLHNYSGDLNDIQERLRLTILGKLPE